eukprot:m.520350 g.520350  ORF g.520350 m.520350 type:complete len:1192 (+) comp57494_c0_seq1:53-3628(+)
MDVHRTEVDEFSAIASLTSAHSDALFGRYNIPSLVEKAFLAVSASAIGDAPGAGGARVAAFAAFYDSPDIAGVPQSSNWPDWFAGTDGLRLAPSNTVFLRLALFQAGLADVSDLLKTLFVAVPDVEHCVLTVRAEHVAELSSSPLAALFSPLPVAAAAPASHQFFSCPSSALYPHLKIRLAKVEDFDDLIPIFNSQSETLKSYFGEFFLNDLIAKQNDSNKAIVAEVDGVARGFMSISTDLDLHLLTASFDLSLFSNLTAVRKIAKPSVAVSSSVASGSAAVASAAVADGTEPRARSAKRSTAAAPAQGKTPRAASTAALPTGLDKNQLAKQPSLVSLAETPSQTTFAPAVEYEEQVYDAALCICLFCIDPLIETRAGEFLKAAFSLFPEKDYCIITVPHEAPQLQLLQKFVRVAPLRNNILHQELFLTHRFSVLTDLSVRAVSLADVAAVDLLVKTLATSDAIMADVQRALASSRDADGSQLGVFVVLCLEQVVGVVIARSTQDGSRLRAQYDLEAHMLFSQYTLDEHMYLHHFVVNPIFQPSNKFILREAMRLMRKSCAYFRVFQAGDAVPGASSTITSIIDDMLPVRRRRQIEYNIEGLQSNAPSQRIRDDGSSAFALLLFTRRLCVEPKLHINTRLVFVGASDTSLSCLEELLFRSHLSFRNVTLISRHGLSAASSDPLRDDFLSSTAAYSAQERKRVAWRTWVNVVDNVVVALDRKAKQVKLASGEVVPYDHLVLAPGLQYSWVGEVGAGVKAPGNVVRINDATDADQFLSWVQGSYSHQGNIVIYGDTIDALTATNSLLGCGVPPSQLVLVTPQSALGFISDEKARALVQKQLQTLGVQLHSHLRISGWSIAEGTDDEVEAAYFQPASGSEGAAAQRILCEAFVYANQRLPDPTTFHAVNEASLVFDSRLVVNHAFQTNDPAILATGPFTKYSRRYLADDFDFSKVNSKETGVKLAQVLLQRLDPLLSSSGDEPSPALPEFSQPTIVRACVPDGLLYLSTANPVSAVKKGSELRARTLTTLLGGEETPKYLALTISSLGTVSAIVNLSQRADVDQGNLLSIHGLHEQFLNRCVSRFDEGLIPDFHSFLRESWAVALFHDRLAGLLHDLRRAIHDSPAIDLGAFNAVITQLVAVSSEGEDAQAALRKEALALVGVSAISKLVRDRLVDFLSYNSYHLPMYTRPGIW